jgi:hypothetical protein
MLGNESESRLDIEPEGGQEEKVLEGRSEGGVGGGVGGGVVKGVVKDV